ncbi:MAG: uracil-xanthine permease family protein [Myxococcota bacterium]|jgi:uracil permease|nr:uracil-xanthine permease family protein [Myxococcota bacterium]
MSSTALHHTKNALIGGQMLFVAFGALVLVPLLTGLDPNVALFTAGAGTLVFQLVTRRQVPIFLASSFAFIGPIMVASERWGLSGMLSGLLAAGLLYVLVSAVIRWQGRALLERLLLPIVTGPVIIVIGLSLAPVAVNMAQGQTGDGALELFPYSVALSIAAVSALVTALFALLGKGLLRLVPVLGGVCAGYAMSMVYGIVDFSLIVDAPWFAVPGFVAPTLSWDAVVFMLPVAIAPCIEHFGDVIAIGSVTGQNYLEKPGVHRTLLGDGLATALAALFGGPPNTTYSEVTGAVALTRAFNPVIMTWAAGCAIALAFVGKLGALLASIPTPVMGGIMVLLFGSIAVVGLNSLVRAGDDLSRPRSLLIVSLILVIGLGGLRLELAGFELSGIGLAGLVGVLCHTLIPLRLDQA